MENQLLSGLPRLRKGIDVFHVEATSKHASNCLLEQKCQKIVDICVDTVQEVG